MNRLLHALLFIILFQTESFGQNLDEIASRYNNIQFSDYSEIGKKSDSISSKISFFGLDLISQLDILVQEEINKTELLKDSSWNRLIDQKNFSTILEQLKIPDTLKRKYVLKDIGSITYVGVFIMVKDLKIRSVLSELGAKVSFSKANLITAYVPVHQIKSVLLIPEVEFVETAIPVKQNLDKAREFANVNNVHSGFMLPKGYTGKDVLIGIIDEGFDYGHPAFYDSLGNYRVFSIWNQNDSTGESPADFDYGTEEKLREKIIALKTDDEEESHGTHVAGITSGANWSTTQEFKGVAYNSKLVMVSYSSDENNLGVFDGVNYIYQKSLELQVPSVVNMSLGSHIGPHDGTSLFDQLCDVLLENGDSKQLSIVGAAGNEGKKKLHASKKFTNTDTSVYSFVRFERRSCGSPCFGVNGEGLLDIWGEQGKPIAVRVGIYNKRLNQFEYITPNLSSEDNWEFFTSKLNDGTEVFKIYTRSSEIINSKPHIAIRINSFHLKNNDDRQVIVNFNGRNTEFNAWANHEYYVSFSDENLNFSNLLNGDSDYSIGEIGGTGKSVITVGAYNSANTLDPIGGRASFSSYGPTVDGRLKPDITAPGNRIASSVNSYDQNYFSSGFLADEVVKTYDFLGRKYNYAWMDGTSMSSPVVAGIIALWKEAAPFISTNQIKEVIANTSIRDQFTGSVPNKLWGYGKIDAHAGIKYIITKMPDKPKLSVTGDTAICIGTSIRISAPIGFKKYLWNTGDTTRAITVNKEGKYLAIVQNNNGWWSYYSDTLNVFIDSIDAKISRFKPDNCLNSIYLRSNISMGQSISWLRNDTLIAGANSAQFVPQLSGVYKAKVQNNSSKCFDISDTVIVDMTKYNNRLFKSDSIITCSTDSIELDAGPGFKTYTWNTGARSQKIRVGKTGMYSVKVNCGEDILNFGYANFPANSPNSSRSFLRIPDANHLDFKDEMSILMSLNVGSLQSSRPTILNKGSDASYQIFLNWPMLTFNYPGMDKREGVSVRVPQNAWFSIGVVKTKDSVFLYYNGNIVDRAPAKTPIPVNNSPITIGKRADVDFDFFVGGIDQLSFWNRSLTQDEVRNFINCTNGTDQGCVGFYNFDPTENDQSVYKNHATYFNSAVGGWLGLYGLNPFTICSGSKSVSDSVYIKFDPLPTGKISFTHDIRCVDRPISFQNTSDSSKVFPLKWTWNMGDGAIYNTTSVQHIYKKVNTYAVKLILTSSACPSFRDSLVRQIIVSGPIMPERYKPINAKKNTETPVQARSFGVGYSWNPGVLVTDSSKMNTKVKVIKETDFKISITNSAGCLTVDSQLVRVFDNYSVFVPSAFSPDNNGFNDRLRPILVGIREVKSFRIYSRWGNLIYSNKDISLGWDGTFNGSRLPTDTYTWVFEGTDEDGKPVIMSGKTTLIR